MATDEEMDIEGVEIDEDGNFDGMDIDEDGNLIMPATSPAPSRPGTTPKPKTVKTLDTPNIAGFDIELLTDNQPDRPQQPTGGKSNSAKPTKMRARQHNQKAKPSLIDADHASDDEEQRPPLRTSKNPVLDSPVVPDGLEHSSPVRVNRDKNHTTHGVGLQGFNPSRRSRDAIPSSYPKEQDEEPVTDADGAGQPAADADEDFVPVQPKRKAKLSVFVAGSSAPPSPAVPNGAASASADPATDQHGRKAKANHFASETPTSPMPHGAVMDDEKETDDLKPTAQSKSPTTRGKSTTKSKTKVKISALELEEDDVVEEADGDPFDISHVPRSRDPSQAAQEHKGKKVTKGQTVTKPSKTATQKGPLPKKKTAAEKEPTTRKKVIQKTSAVTKRKQGAQSAATKQAPAAQQTSEPGHSDDDPKDTRKPGYSTDNALIARRSTRPAQRVAKAPGQASTQDVIEIISDSDSEDMDSDVDDDSDYDEGIEGKQLQTKAVGGTRQLRNNEIGVTVSAAQKPVHTNDRTGTAVDDEKSSGANVNANAQVSQFKKSLASEQVAADPKLKKKGGTSKAPSTQTKYAAAGYDNQTVRQGASSDVSDDMPPISKAAVSHTRQGKQATLAPSEKHTRTTDSSVEEARKTTIIPSSKNGPTINGKPRAIPKTTNDPAEDQNAVIYQELLKSAATSTKPQASQRGTVQHRGSQGRENQGVAKPATSTKKPLTHNTQSQPRYAIEHNVQQSAINPAVQSLTSSETNQSHEVMDTRKRQKPKVHMPSRVAEVDEEEEMDLLQHPFDDQTSQEASAMVNEDNPASGELPAAVRGLPTHNITQDGRITSGTRAAEETGGSCLIHVRDEAQAELITRMASDDEDQDVYDHVPPRSCGFSSTQNRYSQPVHHGSHAHYSKQGYGIHQSSVSQNRASVLSQPTLKRPATTQKAELPRYPMDQRPWDANAPPHDVNMERISKRARLNDFGTNAVPMNPRPGSENRSWAPANGHSSDDVWGPNGPVQQSQIDNAILQRLRGTPRDPPHRTRGPARDGPRATRAHNRPQMPHSMSYAQRQSMGANAIAGEGHMSGVNSSSSPEGDMRRTVGSHTWQHERGTVNGQGHGAGQNGYGQHNGNQRGTEPDPEQNDGLGAAMHQIVQVSHSHELVSPPLY